MVNIGKRVQYMKYTRKQAIEQFCINCLYDPQAAGEGTKHQQIEACLSTDCPLYAWRPVTSSTKQERKDKKYAALSPYEKELRDAKAEVHRIRTRKNLLG